MGKPTNGKQGSVVLKIANMRRELSERFSVKRIGVFGSLAKRYINAKQEKINKFNHYIFHDCTGPERMFDVKLWQVRVR